MQPHFDVFTTTSTSKKMFLFRARAEKGIARHIDASSVVWSLVDNGKLANQIARLVAIVVKTVSKHLSHGILSYFGNEQNYL